ncbi:hypothetical protein [Actinoplanes siamensis]|nr:hypothetical protein [Actinoplanes siamensis]
MSVPGNSVILLLLLSAFVGCVGYAMGRLHERRQSGEEREEAYRDGYDHAARSVFSLAARVAGPRRRGAVRASAAVAGDPAPVASATPAPTGRTSSRTEGPVAAGPTSGRRGPERAAGPSSFGFPAPTPHVVPGLPEPAAEGGVRYSSLPDPSGAPGSAWSPVPAPRHAAAAPPEHPENVGRHTLPDELVRAATYKLAADRTARARIPSQQERPSDPGRPPVPRPRGR